MKTNRVTKAKILFIYNNTYDTAAITAKCKEFTT